jgi:HK97 family phage portal protein
MFNFLKVFKGGFGKKSTINISAKDKEDYFFNTLSSSVTATTSTDYLNTYQLIEYVGKCVSIIAGDTAERPWILLNQKGEKVEDRNISRLLERPNADQNYYEFIYQLMIHQLLDGNHFIIPDITNLRDFLRKLPTELIPIIPNDVDVYTISNELITDITRVTSRTGRYRVQYDHKWFEFKPGELYHGKYPSPHNNLRGMGLVRMNNKILNSSRLSTLLTEKFIDNGAKLDYIMIPEKELGATEHERFKEQTRREISGWRNFFKVFIPPVKVNFQKASLDHSDINNTEMQQITRDDITNVMFNIPAVRLGLSEKSKQNTTQAEMKTYHNTALPGYWSPVEYSLDRVVKLYNPNLTFKLVQKEVVDLKEMAEVGSELKKTGSINGNEHREMVNLSRDDSNQHLNTYYIPANIFPADFEAAERVEDDSKSIETTDNKKTKGANPVPNEYFKFLRAVNRQKATLEKRFAKELNKYYSGLEKRVLEGLDKDIKIENTKAAEIDDIFNWTQETEIAVKMARRSFSSIVVRGLTQYNEFFDSNVDTTTKNPNLTLVVEKLSKNYVSTTLNTNREDLRNLLIKNLDEGQTIDEIKNQIKEYFDEYTDPQQDWKAVRIARTETAFAYDQSAKLSFQNLGVKEFQVIGCEDAHNGYDCDTDGSKGKYPISYIDNLNFHPNHTGTIVPVLETA